ncbi:MAG: NUDIX domain-containing protein [Candidatus Aenigmatarchaeota archaeon]
MLNQRVMVTAVIRKGDRYLVLKRSRWNEAYSGQWQFPEGGVKFGESPEKALARELKEETGLVLKGAKLIGISSGNIRYFNKRVWHFIRILYECEAEGNINLSRAHEKHEWVGRDKLRELRWLRGFKFIDVKNFL